MTCNYQEILKNIRASIDELGLLIPSIETKSDNSNVQIARAIALFRDINAKIMNVRAYVLSKKGCEGCRK